MKKNGCAKYWGFKKFCSVIHSLIGLSIFCLLFIISHVVNAQAYPTPTIISPSSGAAIVQSSQNPCFTWSMPTASGFSNYAIAVSTTPSFPTTRWQYLVTSISSTSLCWNNGAGWASKGTSPPPAPGALQVGTTYYWRVSATYTNGTQTGLEVAGSPFTITAPPPPSPVALTPISGAVIVQSNQNPCFTWSMPSASGFSNYTLAVSTSPSFPTTRWQYLVTSISSTSLCWNNGSGWVSKGTSPPPAPGALQVGTTYYWRVSAAFTDGNQTGLEVAGRPFIISAPPQSSSSSFVSSSKTSSSKSSLSSSITSSKSSSAPVAQTVTTSFTYDDLGRIKTVTHPNAVKNTYTYDSADNRTKKESTAN